MPQCREERLLAPPAGDLCMVPREEDVRHGLALEITRARILWIAEQPIEEGVRRGGCGITEHARQHPRRGVHGQHGGNLPARQDKIADGDQTICEIIDPRIKALVMPADEHQLLIGCEFLRCPLGEHLACRIEDDRAAVLCMVSGLPIYVTHGCVHGLWFQHHACPAAARCIVHMMMLIRRVVAKICIVDVDDAALHCTADDAAAEHTREHRGKERHKVNSHSCFILLSAFLPHYSMKPQANCAVSAKYLINIFRKPPL